MDVFAEVEAKVLDALAGLQKKNVLPQGLDFANVAVEQPRDPAHGDLACNAAMVLAKAAGKKPRDIADALAAELQADADVVSAEVAGPGFLNLRLRADFWHGVVRAILSRGTRYGASDVGKRARTNVEYVSANPTGPMHVGHCRGAVFGDALANLLAFAGYDVTREYYINDAGGQVDVLARSVFLRYREALGEAIGEIPEGLYPGDYLKPVGEALAKEHGPSLINVPEERWLPLVRTFAIDRIMPMIKNDLAALNIKHDVFFSEASLTKGEADKVSAAIADLRARGLIYEGRLEKPKGHDDEEWEDREQTLFRSTEYGDEADRALMKADGSYTYFAGDVAYHYDKLNRGYRHMINVFGADHIGYIPRMLATVAALTGGTVERDAKGKLKHWHTTGGSADLDIKVVNLVKLYKNGEPYKMSKRAGTFVTLRDVVDEVGSDAVRFMMLYRKELEQLDFDFAKVTEQSKDNPVFYVQYAHARAASVLRNAREAFSGLDTTPGSVAGADLALLTDPGELDLIRRCAHYPSLIAGAARAHEPHRVAFYLYDLASAFHSHWTRGNDLPQLRVIQQDDRALTAARCALVASLQLVLSSGLAVLGVGAPEAMR
ncbi:arginyl-tRNA synthetase [Hyphomicrobium nitrativorans NL23]|uniref:Arginine--tRNA ligase n=1 Tax=Hyphomicrobium nitrativorans NL23 TaxID=1029756 RepID=V5SDL2_9HYPH|nr:arginine--tRNA ligase [Hyphomicrobium nitrativorans]AHB48577.1 arginyl-tRNA synthetase [Hyphomicrobium nitrativorans NL23]